MFQEELPAVISLALIAVVFVAAFLRDWRSMRKHNPHLHYASPAEEVDRERRPERNREKNGPTPTTPAA
jgi:hypothetical protein